MKRSVLLLLAGVCAVLFATESFAQEEESACHGGGSQNLLKNPGFEEGDELPDYWSENAFIPRPGQFFWSGISFERCRSVKIVVPHGEPNDVRWVQHVRVEPYTEYRLVGWIKTKGVEHSAQAVDAGANLSVFDNVIKFVYTPPLFGDNDWTEVEVTFNSGPETELWVAARIGMFSGTTTGTAWFDNVRLYKVKSQH